MLTVSGAAASEEMPTTTNTSKDLGDGTRAGHAQPLDAVTDPASPSGRDPWPALGTVTLGGLEAPPCTRLPCDAIRCGAGRPLGLRNSMIIVIAKSLTCRANLAPWLCAAAVAVSIARAPIASAEPAFPGGPVTPSVRCRPRVMTCRSIGWRASQRPAEGVLGQRHRRSQRSGRDHVVTVDRLCRCHVPEREMTCERAYFGDETSGHDVEVPRRG
jgi:hypothetical protein